MSAHVGLGTSEVEDAFLAGNLAAKAACQQIPEASPDLLLVFASVRFNQAQLLRGIKSVCPEATILGCSTAGEITTAGSTKDSVAIMGFDSEAMGLSFATGLGCGLSQDARAAGQKCAQEAIRAKLSKRQVFVMFPDGLSGNGSEVTKGVQEVLGTSFPVVGGSAGDDFRFKKTYQYYNGKALNDSVAGILLGGEISVGIGIRHGWSAIGKTHKVSQAKGNIINRLDAKPAFRIYRDYFGEAAEDLKRLDWAKVGTIYPLGMSIPGEEEYLIRYVFRATESEDLVCAAEVPEGSQVRLMITDKEGVINAAREATLKAKENLKDANILAVIIFDSIARKRVLGKNAQDEIKMIQNTLGRKIPIIGFYSYGEQAPLTAERYAGISYLHNETIAVLCIAASK
ncbi:MAG: FIST C-terminal domain-containing protein [Candidatus Omnitrophica bacterium]|nr:FIST C-terminal domain-containing protein [Candidatus Omnitrophota bacterium]